MKTIRVTASRDYDVCIGAGLLGQAGERIAESTGAARVAIVSDDRVWALYGPKVESALQAAGIKTVRAVFPHGEKSKTLETYAQVIHVLSENRFSRSDAVVALGGGVPGDLGGFAAATYQRGMGFVQIPTTLLAAVDSSVGGKTGVDLPEGKNQVGAFYQPNLVLCDPDTLATLPREEYRSGCAEVIKYGLLEDADFFRSLAQTPVEEQTETVIAACVAMKRDIVARDERDTGCRRLLNLGHTVGHAVESCGGYTISHGEAVAIGMAVITRAAAARGICSRETAEAVEDILRRYGLPDQTVCSREELCQAALRDKKIAGGRLHLVVPEAVGRCRIVPIDAMEFGSWLRDGGVR